MSLRQVILMTARYAYMIAGFFVLAAGVQTTVQAGQRGRKLVPARLSPDRKKAGARGASAFDCPGVVREQEQPPSYSTSSRPYWAHTRRT